jgi:hypothetical protein
MRKEGDQAGGKAPEQSQLPVVLAVDMLSLKSNQGGIEPENKANFPPSAGGVKRGTSGVSPALRPPESG